MYPQIPRELVADPLVSAEHSLITTALEKSWFKYDLEMFRQNIKPPTQITFIQSDTTQVCFNSVGYPTCKYDRLLQHMRISI